jgi:tetratricopeptide (TPR) repeat protein
MRWPRSTPGSLAIYGKALGPEHPAVATLLNNLGQVEKAEGRYADAEPPIKRSLAIREKVLGRDHPDVARSLNNLADLFERQRHYADAEPLYQRAVAIRERALGSDHPDLWTSLNNLAFLYQAEGRTPDVLPLVERTIASGHAQLRVALPVLSAAPRQQLMPAEQALDDALNAVQRAGARAVLTGSRSRGNRRRFAGARMSTRPSGALTALPFRPAVWGPCVDRRGGGPIGRECAPQHLRYGG